MAPGGARSSLLPIAIGSVAFAIALIGMSVPSVWYDEAATITAATRTWPQLWAMLGNVDAVHAVYYAAMHIVFDVIGYSPFTLRLPSAIAVGLTAALVVVIGRQLGTARLGVIAGIVFALIPRVTWMGTEGRSYAATALLAALATFVVLLARRTGSRRAWVIYAAIAVASCLLFLYLALVIVAHGVALAMLARRGPPDARSSARRWLVAAAVAAVAVFPFARVVIGQSGQVSWIDPIGAHTVNQVLRSQWFYSSESFAIVAWALIVLGLAIAIRRRDRVVTAMLLPALVLPTVALIGFSVLASPIYQPRYLSMCTPFVALAVGYGIAAIRWRVASGIALALVIVLAIPQIVGQRLPESKERSAWSQVADLIASDRAIAGPDSTTAVIYGTLQRHPKATARVIEYSYPAAFVGTVDPTLRTPAGDTAQLWETRAPIADSLGALTASDADVVYLITSFSRDQRPATTAALASIGWHVARTWDFTNVHVLRYER